LAKPTGSGQIGKSIAQKTGNNAMSASATTQPASGNFVARLWRGDVSLGKTYWLFGVLAGFALRLVTWPVKYEVWSHAGSMSRFDILTLLYGWAALVILYSISF
jgi:hypothetical protein